MDGTTPRLDAKPLYRHLDRLFGAVDGQKSRKAGMVAFLEELFRTLRDDLHLERGLLYAPQRDDLALAAKVGADGPAIESIDPGLVPLQLIFGHGVYIFADPWSDDSPERFGLLSAGPAAGVAVGRKPHRYVLLFQLGPRWVREELDFALNTVRAALGARLMEERLRGGFKEAARIQQSLLLEEPPAFAGYDLAARSVAAEEVGGDFFDFLPLDDDMLGLALGDASGHGLPAALLVRDVVTGLRMGIEKDLKVAQVFGRLNRVIHRSSLSSRFVSVFYAEVEKEGAMVYVNAGHPPGLLFTGERVLPLSIGGTVIGPLPEARFRRGLARVLPGDVLLLTSDGILERRGAGGEFFGEERLKATVKGAIGGSASDILSAVFDSAVAFGNGRPWEDDATVVVLRREPEKKP